MGSNIWDLGSMWVVWTLSFLVVTVTIILVVALLSRRVAPATTFGPDTYLTDDKSSHIEHAAERRTLPQQSEGPILAQVIKSLAPTLVDDEHRVMDEIVKAGGEVLQSDLPRLTDFSKATVSKAIHGLEVRGIVVREKHKWTFWCKINPRLVERTLQEQPELQEPRPITA